MSQTAYLTIDDGPTIHTADWLRVLSKREARAFLFCRGDRILDHFDTIVAAVKEGHVLGNHSYGHVPACNMSFENWVADLQRCDTLLDLIYSTARVERPGRFYRFPYLDRGDGDRLERHLDRIIDYPLAGTSTGGRVAEFQQQLKLMGFEQPFSGVTHPVASKELAGEQYDCLATFSTFDWKLTDRHRSTGSVSLDDLKRRIENDVWLLKGSGAQIVLFHDDPDGLAWAGDVLIAHMQQLGIDFRLPAGFEK